MGFFTRDDPYTEGGAEQARDATRSQALSDLGDAAGTRSYNASQRQAAQMDAGPQDEMRNQQNWMLQQLQQQIQGNGPSVAQNQLQQGLEAQRAQAASLAASGGGANPAMAQRQAQMAAQAAAAQTNQQAGLLRAQEQLGAMSQFGGLAGQARGQDIGFAGQNLQAQQQQQALNDAIQQFYASQQMGAAGQQYQGQLAAMGAIAGQPSTLEQLSPILGGAAKGLAGGAATTLFQPGAPTGVGNMS